MENYTFPYQLLTLGWKAIFTCLKKDGDRLPRADIFKTDGCFEEAEKEHSQLKEAVEHLGTYAKFMVNEMYRTADGNSLEEGDFDWKMFRPYLIGDEADLDIYCQHPKIPCKSADER